jgi:MFS superfamily sulfate permease-like transporter
MTDINPFALAIGLGVLAVTIICEALNPRIPGAFLGLAMATIAAIIFQLDRHGVSEIGYVPSSLPHLKIPTVDFQSIIRLTPLAIVIALVVMMQTAATTRSFSPPNESPDVDVDFIGVGAGNVIASLLGAFPVNASPPRTAIAAQTGGRSQIVGLLAATVVLALIAFGTTLLSHIPQAALAGVLLFIAQRIFRLRAFVNIFRRTRAELILALATLAAIVVFPIQTGVAIGILLSLLHGVYSITQVCPIAFERVIGTTIWWPPGKTIKSEKEKGIFVLGFQAPLSFLNAYVFRRGVLDAVKHERSAINLIILEASSIVEIDYTASNILSDVIEKCRSNGVDFAVARLESIRAQNSFQRFGLTDLLGQDHLFHSVEEAINAFHSGTVPSRHGPVPTMLSGMSN